MEAADGGFLQMGAWLLKALSVSTLEHDDLSHLSSAILTF
jgi:hypothetical protein